VYKDMLIGVSSFFGDVEARMSLELISDLLDQSLATCRTLTSDLAPTILSEGLGAALEWLSRQMGQKHGLAVHVEAAAEVPQDEQGVTALLFQATAGQSIGPVARCHKYRRKHWLSPQH
jgi:signal transduction histidine kinase